MRMKRNLLLASHPNSKIKIFFGCYLEMSSMLGKFCICIEFRAGACIIIQNRELEEQGQ